MGFYPVTPGINYYVFGSPLFSKIIINLENGKTFTINADGVSDKNYYIKSAWLNGEVYENAYLLHSDIMKGGELTFEMSNKPNKKWGSEDKNTPLSSINDHLILPNPYIKSGSHNFIDSTMVELADVDTGAVIHYFSGKTDSLTMFNVCSAPFYIDNTGILCFYASKDGCHDSFLNEAGFIKMDKNKSINLLTSYAPQYAAGGDMALIDGEKGGDDYKLGNWQGYYGVNLEAIVDLGEVQNIHTISVGFLQDINAWIFMPEWVEIMISPDGENFKSFYTVLEYRNKKRNI